MLSWWLSVDYHCIYKSYRQYVEDDFYGKPPIGIWSVGGEDHGVLSKIKASGPGCRDMCRDTIAVWMPKVFRLIFQFPLQFQFQEPQSLCKWDGWASRDASLVIWEAVFGLLSLAMNLCLKTPSYPTKSFVNDVKLIQKVGSKVRKTKIT